MIINVNLLFWWNKIEQCMSYFFLDVEKQHGNIFQFYYCTKLVMPSDDTYYYGPVFYLLLCT